MGEYIAAFSFLSNPLYWGVLLATVLLVGALGIIPGVGGPTVLALALPFIVFNVDDPIIGLTFLAAMAGIGNTLDSVPAILLGYPSAATQVTFLEGHQLALKGKAAHTLGAVYAVSAIGGIVGAVALLIAMPFLRPVMLRISFPEIAAMAMFGVLMVSVLSRGAMVKGLIAGLLGILLGTVGTASTAPSARLDLGFIYLFDGIPLIPAIIGIFALPELIDLTMRGVSIGKPGTVSTKEVIDGVKYGLSKWPMVIRQSLFGVFLGAVPGIGSAVVDWLAYAFGISLSKDKTQFGKGNLDGVLFAESAQNSKEGGQIIPTLAFGVPGGLSWAILLVAMTSYGLVPGLGMLDADRGLSVTMSMVATLALGNLFIALLGMVATSQLAKLTLVPYALLAAALLPVAFLAAFATTNQWGDIMVVLVVTIVGLVMKWLGWPRPPLILGFILGPVIESNLWPAYNVWGIQGILTRPVTVGLVVVAVATVIYLTRAMGQGSAAAAAASTAPTSITGQSDGGAPAGGSGERPSWSARLQPRSLKLTWRWETLFPLVLLGVAVWALSDSLGYRPSSGEFLPKWVTLIMIPLISLLILRLSFAEPNKNPDIMDLGMRTGTDAAAGKRLAVVLAWIAAYLFGVATIGMSYASVAFTLLFGIARLDWPLVKRIWVLAPTALVAGLVFGLFERVMYVQWPDKLVLEWLGF